MSLSPWENSLWQVLKLTMSKRKISLTVKVLPDLVSVVMRALCGGGGCFCVLPDASRQTDILPRRHAPPCSKKKDTGNYFIRVNNKNENLKVHLTQKHINTLLIWLYITVTLVLIILILHNVNTWVRVFLAEFSLGLGGRQRFGRLCNRWHRFGLWLGHRTAVWPVTWKYVTCQEDNTDESTDRFG